MTPQVCGSALDVPDSLLLILEMQAENFDTSCQLSKNLLYRSSSTHVSSLHWGRENEDNAREAYTEERHTCYHKKQD